MKPKFTLLAVLAILFNSLASFAEDEWKLYKSINGINISYKEADCYSKDNPAQVVYIFKFENTNNSKMKVEWDLRVWYDGVEAVDHVSNGERHQILILSPKQTIIGDCSMTDERLYLYKAFINLGGKKLTRFEFENLKAKNTK